MSEVTMLYDKVREKLITVNVYETVESPSSLGNDPFILQMV